MHTKIRVVSFNCQSFNSSKEIIKLLLDRSDILVLQETLVTDVNRESLEVFAGADFRLACVPAVRGDQTFVGRASGGMAIYYRHFTGLECDAITFSSRFQGLKLQCKDYSCLILNSYFNCDYRTNDSMMEYLNNLSVVANILINETYDDLMWIGDFNSDPSKGRFFEKLDALVREFSLYAADIANLPASSYTYISKNETAATSWLDHVICSRVSLVDSVEILYGTTFSDHIPLACNLRIPALVKVSLVDDNRVPSNTMRINWDRLSDNSLLDYGENLDSLALNISFDVLTCSEPNCRNADHHAQLTSLYDSLIQALHIASEPLMVCESGKFKQVIGWNMYCKSLYAKARGDYLIWHDSGRVRSGGFFNEMKNSRNEFRKALRYCRENEARVKKDVLLEKFLTRGKNSKEFWRETRKQKKSQKSRCQVIDGVHDQKRIVEIFDNTYRRVLNNPESQTPALSATQSRCDDTFSASLFDLRDAIVRLNLGMGWDQIHTNHLKYSGPIFQNLLCKFFNKILSHSFVPRLMLRGEIRPVLKGDRVDKGSSANYRPVMNSSVILKLFEYVLLPFLEKLLNVDSHQFGFRKNTGCLDAVTILKETVLNYNGEGSRVHCALVDLSKAYDCINVEVLSNKLRSAGCPNSIVDVINFMGTNTTVSTVFNGFVGSDWQVGNGARQGGILSGLMFNFYINDAIKAISALPQGCKLAGTKMNIVCYADDILVLAPSARGLQILLDRLVHELEALCLKINVQKSSYIVFRRKGQAIDYDVFLKGRKLEQLPECVYLGINLSETMALNGDIERATTSFLRQFNGLYYKFYRSKGPVLNHLFRSHAMSFYGMETWFHNRTRKSLKKIAVAYHNSVKRVCGLNQWDGNHVACETVGVNIFRHLHARRLIGFVYKLFSSSSPCISQMRSYFRYKSNISESVAKIFYEDYQLMNVFCNPLCAIIARIYHVERNEPRLSDLRNVNVTLYVDPSLG